jgi:hypothetical protein
MCSFHPGMVGAIVVGAAAEASGPSLEPSLVAATTTGDADDGPAVAVLIGAGALMLGTGLGMGLVLGRRRTATTSD